MPYRKRIAQLTGSFICAYVLVGLTGSRWQFAARASAAVQQPGPATVVAQVPLRAPRRIDVTINGQGPFSFGFDTGASGDAWVTRALVKKLNLPTIDRMRVSDGSGVNSREVETVRIDNLRLGELSFERLRVPVLGDGPKQDDDTEAYGTLGFELFRDYLLTLDFPQNQLRVATGQLPDPDDQTVLRYFLDSGAPHIEIDLAGRRVRTEIDSGSGGGIVLPRRFAETLPLRGSLRGGGKVASSLGVFDLFQGELAGDLKIGTFTFPQPVLFFSDLVKIPNLGRNIIRTFAMTFDQRNRRVRFTRP
jgi:predicted aspartyl protease